MAATSLPAITASRWVPVVFMGATGLGLIMRLSLAGVALPVPFDHLLHAHSHALYFGWGAAAVLGAATASTGMRRWAGAGLALVPVMALAFLVQGYGPASIAASTAVMVAWYGAIAVWWRHRDDLFGPSFLYVVMASGGVWVLAFLQATGRGDGLAGRLAIHAFLSTFAWSLVLGTVAMEVRRGHLPPKAGRGLCRGLAAVAWLLFPLGVAGGPEVPLLGWAARAAALGLVPPTARLCRTLWCSPRPQRFPAAWLAAAVAGLVAVAAGGTPLLTAVGRPAVVIYLHALLLGYVSAIIIGYLADGIRGALGAHHLGVAVMLFGVAAPLIGIDPALGTWTAVAGAALVWGAGWVWAPTLWRQP